MIWKTCKRSSLWKGMYVSGTDCTGHLSIVRFCHHCPADAPLTFQGNVSVGRKLLHIRDFVFPTRKIWPTQSCEGIEICHLDHLVQPPTSVLLQWSVVTKPALIASRRFQSHISSCLCYIQTKMTPWRANVASQFCSVGSRGSLGGYLCWSEMHVVIHSAYLVSFCRCLFIQCVQGLLQFLACLYLLLQCTTFKLTADCPRNKLMTGDLSSCILLSAQHHSSRALPIV